MMVKNSILGKSTGDMIDEEIIEATGITDIPMMHWVVCLNDECEWEGNFEDCGSDYESEGWEHPEYQVATCPKCGEVVEI